LLAALNTIKVALIGNIFAMLFGIIFGIGRLSNFFLLNKISYLYIESFRNIPLLLQLFFWYALFTEILPGVRQALEPFSNIFLSKRGLVFPWPINGHLSLPVLEGFNFSGGKNLSPELLSLLLGLTLYTGAFIAEIVRAGIECISKGQWEAAQSLGLSNWQILKHDILPQSMRIIIPPLTSQILNLTKNSSLAVTISYPDFVSVANTSINQTGRAVELISLIMLFYLSLSLSLMISLCMNLYNNKMSLVER
jgi:general L-amino acid transport system permease protein